MKSEIVNIPSPRMQKLVKRMLVVLLTIPILNLFVYSFLDLKGISFPLFALFLLLPLVIIILNQYKKFIASKFLGLIGYNIIIFLVASSEPKTTGFYFHFVSCCAASIVLFDHRERWKSILFITFSVTLFLIIHVFTLNIIPFREFSSDTIKILFIFHTITASSISSFCIFIVIASNYNSLIRLIESKELLEKSNLELLKANEELDRFVYSASHDLKAPLSTIRGLATLMEIDKETPPQEFIQKIKRQADTMDKFIQDVVNYSRNSRAEVKLEMIDVWKLINDIHQTFMYFENADKIVFENCIEPNRNVYSDIYRLRVILNNLISNAFRYSDLSKDKPYIKITFHTIPNGQHQIMIEDNGIGIEKEHIPKLFNMFYRSSTVSNGSGLGLFIAIESARKINGSLEVKSEYGKGTIFTLNIPGAIAEEATNLTA